MALHEKPTDLLKQVDKFFENNPREKFTPAQEESIANKEIIHERQGNFSQKEQDEIPKPVKHLYSKKAEIIIFGKPYDWKNPANYLKLVPLLKEKGIKQVFLPDCSAFTGALCKPSDFHEEMKIEGVKFLNGCKAEGLVIPEKSAVFFFTADCYTVVYHDFENDILIAAHAGLRSLIDKQNIIIGVSSRSHESVIEDLMKHAKETSRREVSIVCGIGCTSFKYDLTNPVWGETNKKILSYLFEYYGTDAVPMLPKGGNISLKGIIIDQLLGCNIESHEIVIDEFDTYLNKRELYSHQRAVDTGEEDGRNLICVLKL